MSNVHLSAARLSRLRPLLLALVLSANTAYAADFLYWYGVVVAGTQNAILDVIDELPGDVKVDGTQSIEVVGTAINVYAQATVTTGTGNGTFTVTAALGPITEVKPYVVNYYLATRTPGGSYGPFNLRKSEPLVVMQQEDRRIVREYFHAGLGHYFMTGDGDEQYAIATGAIAGWAPTGVAFDAYVVSKGNPKLTPVCRYYGLPSAGLNTHFYSNLLSECDFVSATWPEKWIKETDAAFYVVSLSSQFNACAVETTKIDRYFNNQSDVNHRYQPRRLPPLPNFGPPGWTPEGPVWCARSI